MTTPVQEERPSASNGMGDLVFRIICLLAGGFVILLAVALIAVLGFQAWPFLSGPDASTLLTEERWLPRENKFGAQVFIYGTIMASAIAMLIAVPLGVGAAAYLSEIASPWIRKVSSFLLELLAAIPSVIFGFWAVAFLARKGTRPLYEILGFANDAGGQSILAAGLVLAVMILPYITAVSFDVCQAVPRSQREGALALGATRWQTIYRVVLPFARPGIMAACFLALGRAIGETMAVTMVIGNSQTLDFSIAAAGDAIPSAIANKMPETTDPNQRAALISLGLMLFVITLLTNVIARRLIAWASKPRYRKWRRKVTQLHESPIEVPAPTPDALQKKRRRAERRSAVMTWVLRGCQAMTIVPLFLILGFIIAKGAAAVNLDLFLYGPNDIEGTGLGHAMLGSVILVFVASLGAVPVGILAAVLLGEYRKYWIVKPVRFIAEQLGGVPSIVIGIFAYSVLVYPIWANESWGFSGWAGSFALGVMMLPVVIRASEEAMRLVPNGLREASYALGATRWQTVLKVVIPASLPAIITGVLLAVGRIAGETAPLLFTAFQSNYWPESMNDRMPSLPYFIYLFSTNPNQDEIDMAWGGAMVLVAFVLFLNVSTRLLAGKRLVSASQAA